MIDTDKIAIPMGKVKILNICSFKKGYEKSKEIFFGPDSSGYKSKKRTISRDEKKNLDICQKLIYVRSQIKKDI